MARLNYDIQYKVYCETRHESVKNTPKGKMHFLAIREIFSLKLGIKCHFPLLGHKLHDKCSSEYCCCIGSTFGVVLIVRRRLLLLMEISRLIVV